jgi:hypothetical protein
MPDPKKPATPEATPTPVPEPNKGGYGAFGRRETAPSRGLTRMDRPTLPGDVVVADGLPLERL